jgi:hypothetical protein
MNTYGEMEIIAQPFSTSTLDWGEWSASQSSRFSSQGKSPQYPLDALGGPQSVSWRCEEACSPSLCRLNCPDPSSPSRLCLKHCWGWFMSWEVAVTEQKPSVFSEVSYITALNVVVYRLHSLIPIFIFISVNNADVDAPTEMFWTECNRPVASSSDADLFPYRSSLCCIG